MKDIQKRMPEPELIFDKSRPGRIGCNVPVCETPEVDLAATVGETRTELHLPEIGELDVMRHFVNLSHINYGIETGFYPLGSCTMKYNPRVNEMTAAMPGFAKLHPMQPVETIPGAMDILMGVQEMLVEITGFSEITLQPLAGAHGEMTCLMLIKAYHTSRGEGERNLVVIPNTAHGTNPASAARCGYDVVSIGTNEDGNTDLDDLQKVLDKHGPQIAALMLTNPSTLGLFEPNIERICELVHGVGGQVFCDGANMNAMVGTTRPGDHGFDCMHLNLHKTFSTPHGGGGPGCGAIGLKHHLEPFLPKPVIRRSGTAIVADYDRPQSIGRVSAFYGQFLMEVRAYTYLRAFGKQYMSDISRHAVLNANYVRARIKDVLPPAHERPCMHEVVVTAEKYKKQHGVRALDISKRLIDYGFHPPTNYFPLIVPECLMIEPTETESKETLDSFCDALISICRESEVAPDLLHEAPTSQIVGRLDETMAVKNLDVRWRTGGDVVIDGGPKREFAKGEGLEGVRSDTVPRDS
ncbi:aminomethyl-transferring glycine dehydrogenase subunit GcvPB [Fimbriimonas ginsengisoli]|uniref:glycine dehydrogenase (aminomethyl-transferring) n=1 Tax=Fimbriimonas ginsengisoli Gsoil 348 TaxID=661478 RepID=A0A068NYU8_FIMGI|nr:aminomethyl-transferring glycine dehydrogenase subunit GcvPB [Fimbriimonas ginsengisoli]AIE87449.1 glycine dehydrogenase subunit 2 [Fimbriimonas ginsengisoli Gsoil 348]